MNMNNFQWTRRPKSYQISEDRVEIVTAPHTDLWQRTYYHFRNETVFQLCSKGGFCRKPSPL